MAGRYTGTHTTKTFSYLFSGARRALEAAESQKEGEFYAVMNCLILQAFTVEAYLNHLIDGPEEHDLQLTFKRPRPSVWEKYEAVSSALKIEPVKLVDAHPEVAAILTFRNTLAHGRTESIAVDEILESDEPPHRASVRQFPDWMNFCDIENAKTGMESVRALIENIHERVGLGKYPLESLGGGMFAFRRLT